MTTYGLPGLNGSSAPAPFSGFKKPKAHHWYDSLSDNALTGFIGNLSDDVVHTTMGIPAGILEMATSNPIDTAEKMAKATWQDWSPLFHGDVRTWAHNTYEHPLAPILDVASVISGGAALSAKGAGLAAKIAEKSAATDVERLAARTGRAAHYANPTKARLAAHEAAVTKAWKGRFGAGTATHAEKVLDEAMRRNALDPAAYRQVAGKVITGQGKAVSTNPLNRLAQRGIDRAAEKSPFLAKHLGPEATFKRWSKMDRGARGAATQGLLARQIQGFRDAGKITSEMTPEEYLRAIHPTMRHGLEQQAHVVDIRHLFTKDPNTGKLMIEDAAWKQFLQDAAKDGYQPVRDGKHVDLPALFKKAAPRGKKVKGKGTSNVEQLGKAIDHWGAENTTDVAAEAMIDFKTGTVKMASKQLEREAKNSTRAMQMLYHNPTQVWKWMVLGASPRYFVNNLVGNSFMLLMSADPVNLSKAMYHHVREVRGVRAADHLEREGMITAARGAGASQAELNRMMAAHKAASKVRGRTAHEQFVGGEFESFALHNLHDTSKGGRALETLKTPARLNFEITHKASDVFHRNVLANYSMNRTPEFQAALAQAEKAGKRGVEARREAALRAYQSPGVRQQVRIDIRHTLGQYHTFDRWEKGVKNVIPFYSWSRAISRHTATLAATAPQELKMLQAVGTEGRAHEAGLLGQVPEFLQSAIPTKELGNLPGGKVLAGLVNAIGGGRDGVMLTAGLNPYASIGDLATSAKGLAGGTPRMGDTVGGQINPVLKGAIETMTGTSMVSGAPIQPIGGIGNIYIGQAVNLPPVKLAQQLAGMTESSPNKLFNQTNEQAIASFFGFQTRSLSQKKALDLWRRQHGISSPGKLPSSGGTRGIEGIPGM